MSTPSLRDALRKRYSMPEWVFMEEVRDAAGFESSRSADGIAMSMWPSRGLEINGFEIKASRSDWLRELKNPAKAEAIAAYCDRWWIVALKDLVKIEELPAGWGLMELQANGSLKEVKTAPARENVKPITRTFMAAMMRRVGELDNRIIYNLVQDAIKEDLKRNETRLQAEIEKRSKKYTEVSGRLDEIKAATGIDLLSWGYDADGIATAIRYAMAAHDITKDYTGLKGVRDRMDRLVKEIDALEPLAGGNDNQEAA